MNLSFARTVLWPLSVSSSNSTVTSYKRDIGRGEEDSAPLSLSQTNPPASTDPFHSSSLEVPTPGFPSAQCIWGGWGCHKQSANSVRLRLACILLPAAIREQTQQPPEVGVMSHITTYLYNILQMDPLVKFAQVSPEFFTSSGLG